MKLLYHFCCIFAFVLSACGRRDQNNNVKFVPDIIEFGECRQGEIKQVELLLANDSAVDVSIDQVVTSCSCTIVNWRKIKSTTPALVIPAKSKVPLDVTIRIPNRIGAFGTKIVASGTELLPKSGKVQFTARGWISPAGRISVAPNFGVELNEATKDKIRVKIGNRFALIGARSLLEEMHTLSTNSLQIEPTNEPVEIVAKTGEVQAAIVRKWYQVVNTASKVEPTSSVVRLFSLELDLRTGGMKCAPLSSLLNGPDRVSQNKLSFLFHAEEESSGDFLTLKINLPLSWSRFHPVSYDAMVDWSVQQDAVVCSYRYSKWLTFTKIPEVHLADKHGTDYITLSLYR